MRKRRNAEPVLVDGLTADPGGPRTSALCEQLAGAVSWEQGAAPLRALYPATPGTSYSYSSIAGRISITALCYDAWNRVTDTVMYGAAGITASAGSWSRAGSVPGRSDTVLVMTTTYNTDGTVQDVTDPKGIVSRTEYDAAGRTTAKISNYVDGTPGGGAADDEDQTIRFEYTNGLQTKYTADLSGTDQHTIYTYSVPKGTGAGDSGIASNRLLWKATYPDSVGGAGGTDVVTTAYNAVGVGQVTSVKDRVRHGEDGWAIWKRRPGMPMSHAA